MIHTTPRALAKIPVATGPGHMLAPEGAVHRVRTHTEPETTPRTRRRAEESSERSRPARSHKQ